MKYILFIIINVDKMESTVVIKRKKEIVVKAYYDQTFYVSAKVFTLEKQSRRIEYYITKENKILSIGLANELNQTEKHFNIYAIWSPPS